MPKQTNLEFEEIGLVGSNRNTEPRAIQPKTQIIIDRATEHLASIPYRPSLRWLFYRLWQDRILPQSKSKKGKKAGAYHGLVTLLARLTHEGNWPGGQFADESRREAVPKSGSDDSVDNWINGKPIFAQVDRPDPDFWASQEYYVALAFEANAMSAQFEHHTDGLPISLWPFGGAPSIEYKNRLADFLTERGNEYDLPVRVLYFGDLDESGEAIGEIAAGDIKKWAECDLEILKAGLYPEQAEGVEPNPDKPGAYQWEALDDLQAGAIIKNALNRYIDLGRWNSFRNEFDGAYAAASALLRSKKIQQRIARLNAELRAEIIAQDDDDDDDD